MFNFLKRKEPEKEVRIVKEEPKPLRKGKIYISSDRGIFPFETLQKYKIEKSSKQLKALKAWQDEYGLIPRPYDPSAFLRLYSRQPILKSCIDVIAGDVSSTGYRLILRDEKKAESEEGKKALESERQVLENFLRHPNERDESLKSIIHNCIVDLNLIGDMAIEIVRNVGGKVAEIYHMATTNFYVHRDMEKFAQKRYDLKREIHWFVPFGSKDVIGLESGEEGDFDLDHRAGEAIFKKLYSPESATYGLPPLLSAVGSILTLISCEEYNRSLFENMGIPQYAVMLEGDFTESDVKRMADHLSLECRGASSAHRTVVFEVPAQGKITFEKLNVEAREGSFRLYIGTLRQDVLAVYHCPPYKTGIYEAGRLGGNLGQAGLRNYIDSTIEPLETMVENIFNDQILPGILGREVSFRFELENVDTGDVAERVEMYVKLFGCGALTPNQLIEKLGLGASYPEGDRYFVQSAYTEIGAVDYEKSDREFFKGIKEITDLRKDIKKIRES